jgi:phosphate/sulfate permease/TPR repeat protein
MKQSMSKFLARIVAILLVLCMISDQAMAAYTPAAIRFAGTHSHLSLRDFAAQALALPTSADPRGKSLISVAREVEALRVGITPAAAPENLLSKHWRSSALEPRIVDLWRVSNSKSRKSVQDLVTQIQQYPGTLYVRKFSREDYKQFLKAKKLENSPFYQGTPEEMNQDPILKTQGEIDAVLLQVGLPAQAIENWGPGVTAVALENIFLHVLPKKREGMVVVFHDTQGSWIYVLDSGSGMPVKDVIEGRYRAETTGLGNGFKGMMTYIRDAKEYYATTLRIVLASHGQSHVFGTDEFEGIQTPLTGSLFGLYIPSAKPLVEPSLSLTTLDHTFPRGLAWAISAGLYLAAILPFVLKAPVHLVEESGLRGISLATKVAIPQAPHTAMKLYAPPPVPLSPPSLPTLPDHEPESTLTGLIQNIPASGEYYYDPLHYGPHQIEGSFGKDPYQTGLHLDSIKIIETSIRFDSQDLEGATKIIIHLKKADAGNIMIGFMGTDHDFNPSIYHLVGGAQDIEIPKSSLHDAYAIWLSTSRDHPSDPLARFSVDSFDIVKEDVSQTKIAPKKNSSTTVHSPIAIGLIIFGFFTYPLIAVVGAILLAIWLGWHIFHPGAQSTMAPDSTVTSAQKVADDVSAVAAAEHAQRWENYRTDVTIGLKLFRQYVLEEKQSPKIALRYGIGGAVFLLGVLLHAILYPFLYMLRVAYLVNVSTPELLIGLVFGVGLCGAALYILLMAETKRVNLEVHLEEVIEELVRVDPGLGRAAELEFKKIKTSLEDQPIARTTEWTPGDHGLYGAVSHDTIPEQTVRDLQLLPDTKNPDTSNLFDTLNRTRTVLGEKRLRWLITHPYLDSGYIEERQGAVHELIRQQDLRLQMRETLKAYGNEKRFQALYSSLENTDFFASLYQVIKGSKIFAGMALLPLFYWHTPKDIAIIMIVTMYVGLIFSLYIIRASSKQFATQKDWRKLLYTTEIIRSGIHDSQDPYLMRIHQELDRLLNPVNGTLRAIAERPSISNLNNAYRNDQDDLKRLAGIFAEFEVLEDLAEVAIEQQGKIHPAKMFSSNQPELTTTDVRPAWIPPSEAVGNDLELLRGSNVWVITGANKNGKSTVMRAVGWNYIAAQIGGFVWAKTMRGTPVRVRAQMNVADSSEKSLWDTETDLLSQGLHDVQESPFYFFAYDELGRGTNPKDKLAVQRPSVIELLEKGVLVAIATHDMELTKIPGVNNVHVEETYSPDGEAIPDYKLRPGPATQTNAVRIFAKKVWDIPGMRENLRNGVPEDFATHLDDALKSPPAAAPGKDDREKGQSRFEVVWVLGKLVGLVIAGISFRHLVAKMGLLLGGIGFVGQLFLIMLIVELGFIGILMGMAHFDQGHHPASMPDGGVGEAGQSPVGGGTHGPGKVVPETPLRPYAVALQSAHSQSSLANVEEMFVRACALDESEETMPEAIELYRRILAIRPRHASAMLNLGSIYYRQREFALAEQFYRLATEADTNYALAFFDLGNALDELKRLDEAIAAYQRAIALVPNYADAHFNLARTFERQGNRRQALRHWLTYVRLDPVSTWANIAKRNVKKILSAEPLSIVSRHGQLTQAS